MSVPWLVAAGLVALMNVLMRNGSFEAAGQPVPYWKVVCVLDGAVLMVMLMCYDINASVVLILGATVWSLLGIIGPQDALAGLSNSTVTAVALLFPSAKAIANTGAVGAFVSVVLGTPCSPRDALVRVSVLVALLSCIVNNTPTVATMVPILGLWCTRIGMDVRQFAMPMAFSGQLGGVLTLMGDPTNFAAKTLFGQLGYDLGFFEMAPAGLVNLAMGSLYFAVVSPMVFGKGGCKGCRGGGRRRLEESPGRAATATPSGGSGPPDSGLSDVTCVISPSDPVSSRPSFEGEVPGEVTQEWPPQEPVPEPENPNLQLVEDDEAENLRRMLRAGTSPIQAGLFKVAFQVDVRGAFKGMRRGEAGFERFPGVHRLECAVRDGEVLDPETPLGAGDLLVFQATAEGVVALRATRGIALPMEAEIRLLGAGRRQRRLFEVELAAHSDLVGQGVSVERLRFNQRCALLSVRRRYWPNGSEKGGREGGPGKPKPAKPRVPAVTDRLSFEGFRLNLGDVLLLEADMSAVGCPAWVRDFGIVRTVPRSAPPRRDRRTDNVRTAVAVVGFFGAILLFLLGQDLGGAMQAFTLTNNLVLLVGLLLICRNLSPADVLEAMEPHVLLTIVGSIPLGEAIQNVGLDQWAARGLVNLLSPTGHIGIYVAIYLVAGGLTQLVSNVAVTALMAPVVVSIASLEDLPVHTVVRLTVLAVEAVFICPIGHQVNMMVTQMGRYSWGDFFKFGVPFQFAHMVVSIAVCVLLP